MTQSLPWRPPQLAVTSPTAELTPRQADVLTGLCHGLTNFQIARRLDMPQDTVKSHLKGLYRALGARDRCHAVSLATSRQIVVNVRGVS